MQLFNQPMSIKKHIIAITFNENPNFTWTCHFSAKRKREKRVFPLHFWGNRPTPFKKKGFHPIFFVLLVAVTPNIHEEGLPKISEESFRK